MYFGCNVLNVSFNNARSFKSHFRSICQNDIVLKQDICIFAESRLRQSDRTRDYAIDDYITIRADQKNTPSAPHYGLIAYVKKSIKVEKILYLSHDTLDILLIVVEYNHQPISFLALYNSPRNSYRYFEPKLLQAIQIAKKYAQKIAIFGDFNIDRTSTYYPVLNTVLDNLQLQQKISKYTTINNTTIDLLYTNTSLKLTDTFYCHWSDHFITHVQINN